MVRKVIQYLHVSCPCYTNDSSETLYVPTYASWKADESTEEVGLEEEGR